jgi:phosphatidate cytidylyltransferase
MYLYKQKIEVEQFYFGYIFSVLLVLSAYMLEVRFIWANSGFLAATFLAIIYFLGELLFEKKITFHDNANVFLIRSVFYIGLMFSYMVLLRELPEGFNYCIYLVAVVWTNDIFAYLIGMPLGRHKLSPKVSPKKSVEGALGALFGAVLMSLNLNMFIGISVAQAIWLGVILSVLAQLGDLVESLLKREFRVKDSGKLFPGHGGILDRLDSFILTTPIFYYLVVYFVK